MRKLLKNLLPFVLGIVLVFTTLAPMNMVKAADPDTYEVYLADSITWENFTYQDLKSSDSIPYPDNFAYDTGKEFLGWVASVIGDGYYCTMFTKEEFDAGLLVSDVLNRFPNTEISGINIIPVYNINKANEGLIILGNESFEYVFSDNNTYTSTNSIDSSGSFGEFCMINTTGSNITASAPQLPDSSNLKEIISEALSLCANGGFVTEIDSSYIGYFGIELEEDCHQLIVSYNAQAHTLKVFSSKYAVNFDVQGHGVAPDPLALFEGDTITRPANDPTCDGYTFEGWYADKECTTEYVFGSTVTAGMENFTIYAKWSQNPSPAPSPTPGSNSAYYEPLSTAIDIAIANGSPAVIEWNAGDSLPKEIVEKVINNPGITIHFTYTYDGVEYDLYLNSENLSKIYKDGIPWFGPLCLAACNGQYTGNGYVVKEGDTLSQIAAMMNTTIEAIMARNPEITDPNVIYIGQIIY